MGHSHGSIVLTMLAAELRRNRKSISLLPNINLLTLGQILLCLSFRPAAKAFRSSLCIFAKAPRISWLDYGSHHDIICFAGGQSLSGLWPALTCRWDILAEATACLEVTTKSKTETGLVLCAL